MLAWVARRAHALGLNALRVECQYGQGMLSPLQVGFAVCARVLPLKY